MNTHTLGKLNTIEECQKYGTGYTRSPLKEAAMAMRNGGSTGETNTVGSFYAVTFDQRPNMAQTRNQGPERAGSGSVTMLPVVTTNMRQTGRISK